MMKIVILCLIITTAIARPSYLPTSVVLPAYKHYTYEPTGLGHTITHLPNAVSHQSQTIIHEKRPYIRPIVDFQLPSSYVKTHYPFTHAKIISTAAPLTYAPIAYTTELYPADWNTGLAYIKSWNGWILK